MKISILDDYFDTLRALECFRKLDGHEVEIWNDHVDDIDELATRLCGTEALVLFQGNVSHGAYFSAVEPLFHCLAGRWSTVRSHGRWEASREICDGPW